MKERFLPRIQYQKNVDKTGEYAEYFEGQINVKY
jgi:hypothetical protein